MSVKYFQQMGRAKRAKVMVAVDIARFTEGFIMIEHRAELIQQPTMTDEARAICAGGHRGAFSFGHSRAFVWCDACGGLVK